MIELLKSLQKIFGILTAAIATYVLVRQEYGLMPYLMFFQGAMLLVMGIDETKEERKKSGVFLLIGSLFLFFVAIVTLLN